MSKKKKKKKNNSNLKNNNTKKNTNKEVKSKTNKEEIKIDEKLDKEFETAKIEYDKIINKDEYYDIIGENNNHTILKVLFFIVLIIFGTFIVYKYVIRDNKAIVNSAINKIYEKLANNIVRLSKEEILKDNISINGIINFNTTNKDYSSLNYYRYDLDLIKSKNNYNLNLDILLNNNIISNLSYYYLNDNYYLELNKDYDKTILLNNNLINIDNKIFKLSDIDFNKLNTSCKTIKSIISSNINRNKLTNGKEIINNNTYEYVDYILTNEEYSNLISNIVDNIKNNNTLMNNLSASFKVDKEVINSYLDLIIKNNLTNTFNKISFRFYISGLMANMIGLKVSCDNNIIFDYFNINNNINISFSYNNYFVNIFKDNNKYNANILKDNKEYIKLLFNEFNKTTIDIDYKLLENNNYGNIHFNKYNKDNNTSGNISLSLVTKSDSSSIKLEYRINDNQSISLNNNTIDINNVNDLDKIKDNIKNKYTSKNSEYFIDYLFNKIKS